VWLERARLDAADRRLFESPLAWAGRTVLATLWFAAGAAITAARRTALLDAVREEVTGSDLAALVHGARRAALARVVANPAGTALAVEDQDLQTTLGKIIRLNDDGSLPSDNPFADQGGVSAQIWSLGHRNPLGIVFDADGRLWVHEMGPKGGDELNLIEKGANYGYPIVSDGDHYSGRPIPDHHTRPEFRAPVISWDPVISPAGFIIYSGQRFPDWQGSGLMGGLSSRSLVRIAFDGDHAREAERFDMGTRIREVEQGPDGMIWLLEDDRYGTQGRLLRLAPALGG
jgi:glucose/arabinose dehydrogenase